MLSRKYLALNLARHVSFLYSAGLLNKADLYIAKHRVQIALSSGQGSLLSDPQQQDLYDYLLAQLLKSPRSFPLPHTLPP